MRQLYVYADFNWFPKAELVGVLSYERVRGSDTYGFEYDKTWFANHSDILLSGDLHNFLGWQYTEKSIFGCFTDALPDRWGRTLAERREQIEASEENRLPRILSSYDYLMSIDDFSRMGAFRFKETDNGPFINDSAGLRIPPLTSVRELAHAAQEIERSENDNELPEKKWILQLLSPGTSLGGARPKASVTDENGQLLIAKFPSRMDMYDVSLWEHFCHKLAVKAGVNAAETTVITTGGKYHVLLSRRFDRDGNGRRIHFASAMNLLGFEDGDGAKTGKGYIDMVDFILQYGGRVAADLKELYRRVAFNMCVGNCDDHFRNHGFLLTPKGWILAPAYDMNPSLSMEHCLMTTDASYVSNLKVLYKAHLAYMLEEADARQIINEVCTAVKGWRDIAHSLQISRMETALFEKRLDMMVDG